ncbi:hypothetical protein SERLA73DRAFT_69692 [Serpula lacrymans var. lacrymans S7.3]|uniref:Uncharacterized protein n=2 Tax=Serpula lacrymans var. lacrymans TaxID=341189 RepID=F8PKF6_SERL3|nr:uncharacterized protein SERLADRAFT_365805 [Serpula lacrymans var. lacrymans S7.9]EGO03870.1 hypothetical protein SERLA73DRAFT_69692 [Serpula lacrymans var. lacrymans S7.3]EGO29797.1 hypothetical protein SERLADRAFT_365805 [Serpula lacrymans var. lacrymans S7.9]
MSNPSFDDSHEYEYDFPDYPSHHNRRHHHEVPAPPPRARLPIPDLRFEQTYLTRIGPCIHIEPRPLDIKNDEKKKGDLELLLAMADESNADAYVTATHASPFLDSSHSIVRIDWAPLAWITVRDQVIFPLLQGILWGVVGHYYRPFFSAAGARLRGKSNPRRTTEGEGVGWLRSWVKNLGLGDITGGLRSSRQ